MKYTAIYVILLMIACSNNKTEDQKQVAGNAPSENKQEPTTPSSSSIDDIVGEWELVGVTEDKNGNDQLDPEERSSALKTANDYMKLNSDGSAVFYVFKTKGRYEIQTDPNSGKRYLDLIGKDDFKHKKGYIMAVSKDELLIMNKFAGNSITIWKRK